MNEFVLCIPDPRTKDWFLIGSPWPGLALLGFYLHFIYRLGPSLMANRPPMKLDSIIRIYNVVQIVLSSYLFYKVSLTTVALVYLQLFNYLFLNNSFYVLLLSFCNFFQACVLGWLTDYNFSCEPVDYSNTPKAIEVMHLF